MPILDIALIALIVIALSGLRVAQEYERGVVFRLGRYNGLRGPGLYWIIPLGVERSVRVDIRTRTVSAEQQETITRDSVTIKVNVIIVALPGQTATPYVVLIKDILDHFARRPHQPDRIIGDVRSLPHRCRCAVFARGSRPGGGTARKGARVAQHHPAK
ncbi:MAG: SPFH domain-containing protein [Pseudomonadota bacterium]|nr:SPFH domain-containing protein [Pseudomonadota bacterium]